MPTSDDSCKCGARTVKVHLAKVRHGHRHPYTGPYTVTKKDRRAIQRRQAGYTATPTHSYRFPVSEATEQSLIIPPVSWVQQQLKVMGDRMAVDPPTGES